MQAKEKRIAQEVCTAEVQNNKSAWAGQIKKNMMGLVMGGLRL